MGCGWKFEVIHKTLQEEDNQLSVLMNFKKIRRRRLMDKYGLLCPVRKANPYRRMAKALKSGNVADNILKGIINESKTEHAFCKTN